MRQKFVFVTAVIVCLAVVAAPVFAAERTTDRSGDRSKADRTSRGVADSTDMQWTYFQRIAREVKTGNPAAATSAKGKLQAAMNQEGGEAIATLNQILRMDLPDSPETENVLAQTFQQLGDLYEGAPSKQVHYYAAALQYQAEAGRRTHLETRINELGGDVFALSFRPQAATAGARDAGDDTCAQAIPIILDHSEVMSVFPSGDHNWRLFTVPGPEGQIVRIETISDAPGSFSDDTDLTLWSDCDADGFPGGFIAFNDDGGEQFMSLIATGCLIPGSYYIEVGGFFDISTPDNFTLDVSLVATCEVPVPDAFEPDDVRPGSPIGFPTANSPRGNGWGRSKKEIQDHSMFPPGDIDLMSLNLTQNSWVRAGTRTQFATFFNGFERSDIADNDDTVLFVKHASPVNYGGFCNEPDIGFPNFCITDADCPDLPNPLPGFPDCIPLYLFQDFSGVFTGPDPELAVNDDRGGGDLGSDLAACLPRTQNTSEATAGAVNGPWIIQTFAFDPNDLFNYQVQVRNEARCDFESEPNNGPLFAAAGQEGGIDTIELGDTIFGFFDFSETTPFQDDDWYFFDVADGEDTRMTFRTFGYDEFEVDTGIELIVGPGDGTCSGSLDPCATDADCPEGETCDDNDSYFLVANDDDGGQGFLSRLDVIAPGPNDILGNVANDAKYYLNVTSFFLNHNYPYELRSDGNRTPVEHAEGGDEGAGNVVGDDYIGFGEIDPLCDLDTYTLSLDVPTFVRINTTGADTAMRLAGACDDDGATGLGSRIEGCLAAGDYALEIRAFGSGTGAYGVEIHGNEGCLPSDPPYMVGDELFTCNDFDTCP